MWDNGWQYFTDPDGNSVAISDTGDYFRKEAGDNEDWSIIWSPEQGRYID
jgi:hypothetical protein